MDELNEFSDATLTAAYLGDKLYTYLKKRKKLKVRRKKIHKENIKSVDDYLGYIQETKESIKMNTKIELLKELKVIDLVEADKRKLFNIIKQKTNEDLEKYINEIKNLNKSLLTEGEAISTVFSILGLVHNPVLWLIYRTIAADSDKCMKKCGTYGINNSSRQDCLSKCRSHLDKRMRSLKGKINCNKAKDPKKCHALKSKIK